MLYSFIITLFLELTTFFYSPRYPLASNDGLLLMGGCCEYADAAAAAAAAAVDCCTSSALGGIHTAADAIVAVEGPAADAADSLEVVAAAAAA